MEVSGEFTARTLAETESFAARLARETTGGTCYLLNGELGAGKTAFAKAFCAALGVKETVTSPTFNLVKEYCGVFPIYHMDLYRLEGAEWEELGLEEYFTDESVVLIEWNKLPRIEAKTVVKLDVEADCEGVRRWKWKIERH